MQVFTTASNKWSHYLIYPMLLLLWEGIARLYPPVILPGPIETLHALAALVTKGGFWQPVVHSFLRFAAGFGLSLVLGGGLGIGAGRNETVFKLVRPAITLLQAVPPVSWMLLAILWLGVQGGAQILVVTIALLPVFFFNSIQGIRQVPRDLLEMAAVFGISRMKRLRDIVWPAIAPFWSAALTVSIGMGWKTVVMSELISGQTGIGAAMNTARIYVKTEDVMAWTLVVAFLGIVLEALARKYTVNKRGRLADAIQASHRQIRESSDHF
ncbi:ABC transporter permease [Paenibacillus marchantiophytorum]|uniref:ABC transporter permease n=1 Tax=Paenibacillus marchantiophytorum TaxID=1619310 RepID=A0ABQ1EWW5_9BACL|nr:ABC transporter permease subunit [Paenibacillus marchantiophytorum]GFZ91056.1 ABC transporter permease [Paenibacillus marchantiophytorum]